MLTESTAIGMLNQCDYNYKSVMMQVIDSCIFSAVSLVSVAALLGNDVFCSSKFLLDAPKNATPFCKLQGALLHYLEGSVALWFVAYNFVIAKVDVYFKLK